MSNWIERIKENKKNLSAIGIMLFIGFLLWLTFTWIATVAYVILLFGFLILIYRYLAPNNRCCTFVNEGTCKPVMKGGELAKFLWRWENHIINEDGWVLEMGKRYKEGNNGNATAVEVKRFIDIKEKFPITVEFLSDIEGIGTTKAENLLNQLKDEEIKTVEELEEAANTGKIKRDVKGFGESAQTKILEAIEQKEGKWFEPRLKVERIHEEPEESEEGNDDNGNEGKIRRKLKTIYREVEEDQTKKIEKKKRSTFFGGLVFYGIWPIYDIGTYKFSWTGVDENGEVHHHSEEILDYVMLKEDVYWCKITEAEDRGLLPLDLELVLPTKIVNPKLCLFEIENWLEAVINRIRPAARDAVTRDVYEGLIKATQDIGEDIQGIIAERGILQEFETMYGARVRKTQVKEIDPPESYRSVTLRERTAKLERKGRLVEADAEAKYRERVAEGEARKIEIINSAVQQYGDLGKLVYLSDTLKETSIAGVLAIPGLPEAFREAFGKKVTDANQQEFEQFKDEVIDMIDQRLPNKQ